MVIEGEKRHVLYTFFRARAIEDTGDYERDRKRKWCGIDDLPDTVAYLFREVAESFQKNISASQSPRLNPDRPGGNHNFTFTPERNQ